jgi:hypothetical protein
MELTGFFPVPDRAGLALDELRLAGFDVEQAAVVTGEDATSVLHKRLAAARRGRSAAGALAAGSLSLILALALSAPAPAPVPWIFVASLVAISVLLGAAAGAYYGMGVEQESVLVGLVVPRERVEEAVRILRNMGGRFIQARTPATWPARGYRVTSIARHDS